MGVCITIVIIGLLSLIVLMIKTMYEAFYLSSKTTIGAIIKTILLTLFILSFFFSLGYIATN